MTSVEITTTKNSVVVSGDGAAKVVTVATVGPQGSSSTPDLSQINARLDALEAAQYLVLEDGN